MRAFAGLALVGLASVSAWVAESQPQREIHGRLFWVDEGKRTAAAGVEIKSQTGHIVRTEPEGSFRLPLPSGFRAGETLSLAVEVPDWFVGRPAAGEVRIPGTLSGEVVEIELYREGSALFWSDERLEKFLVETAWLSLERIERPDTRKSFDLDFYLRCWARRHGQSLETARFEVNEWIERARQGNDALRRGLAAFGRVELETAAELFRSAADEIRRELDAQRGTLSEEEADRLQGAVSEAHGLAGIAHSDARQLEAALTAFEAALDHASRQSAPQSWARTSYGAGMARLSLGLETRDSELRVARLKGAHRAFQQALEVWDRESFPQAFAAAHHGLGRVLSHAAEDEPTTRLAIRSFNFATEVRRRGEVPLLWASTQHRLAKPLLGLASFVSPFEGRGYFSRVVEIYRQLEEVWTVEEVPHLWYAAPLSRTTALGLLAETSPGRDGILLYEEMAETCREVLRHDRSALPNEARVPVYEILAEATTQRAFRALEDAEPWFAEAAGARREALALVDREAQPASWAVAAYDLGSALLTWVWAMTPGADAGPILEEADAVLTAAVREATATGALAAHLPRAKLAEVWWLQDRRNEAVGLMGQVLREDPDDHDGYLILRSWVQDFLHDFELAYRTTSDWVDRHPEEYGARVALTQNFFTTGRFDACLEHIAATRLDPRLGPADHAFLRVFEISTLRILGHPANEIADLVEHLSEAIRWLSPDLPAAWNTRSSSHFVKESEAASEHRAWLVKLFETLRSPDRQEVVEGLRRLADTTGSQRV